MLDCSKYKGADLSILTSREREVFALRLAGKTNKEIGEKLKIKPRSVYVHFSKAVARLEGQEPKARARQKWEYCSQYKGSDLSILTKREREILELRMDGKTIDEVAAELGLKKKSVYQYAEKAIARLEGRGPKDRTRKERKDYSQYKGADLSILTKREREVLSMCLAGKTAEEIAEELRLKKKSIYPCLENAAARLEGKKPKARGKNNNRGRIDCSKYKAADLSILTKREREVFALRMAGKTGKEIAEELQIHKGNAYRNLYKAIERLEGIRPKAGERERYNQYKGADLSILTKREREALTMRMEGKTCEEIAKQIGTKKENIYQYTAKATARLKKKEAECKQMRRYNQYKGADLSILTKREREALTMRMEGKTCEEIAKQIGTKKENIYQYTAKATARLKKKEAECKQMRRYNQYKGADLSILTKREREVFALRLAGKTGKEIAEELQMQQGCAYQTMYNAIERLEGIRPKAKKRKERYSIYKGSDLSVLNNKEREVLALRLAGKTGKEIAAELGIKTETVNQYASRAVAKMEKKMKGELDKKDCNINSQK